MARHKLKSGVGRNKLLLQLNDPLAHQETGLQFERIERLREEIVCTGVHRLQHFVLTILRSQHDRGFIPQAAAKPAAKLDAINLGKDPIEQRQPGCVLLYEEFPRLFAVSCTREVEALFLKVGFDQMPVDGGIFGE
jgi:hypothetical protein